VLEKLATLLEIDGIAVGRLSQSTWGGDRPGSTASHGWLSSDR
jgi:hypothetical protein